MEIIWNVVVKKQQKGTKSYIVEMVQDLIFDKQTGITTLFAHVIINWIKSDYNANEKLLEANNGAI